MAGSKGGLLVAALACLLCTTTWAAIDTYQWMYTLPTGFSCDPNSIKALGADATGNADVSALLNQLNAISDFSSGGMIQVSAGTYKIAQSISLSKTVSMSAGAVFVISSGVTVTFNAPVVAPTTSQIFSGPGTVTFGYGVQASVPVEWFGAKGDGSSDDTTAIQKAVASSLGPINTLFSAKTYRISAPITVGSTTLIQSSPGAVVSALSRSQNGFVFQLPLTNGMYRGRYYLPSLQGFNQAITFSDAGIVDVFCPSISSSGTAVMVQSTRGKGAGRQVSQLRVEVSTVTNVGNVVTFFDTVGGAVMQGSQFLFGTVTDTTGVMTSLLYFRTNGGQIPYWDSNNFQFARVTPAASSGSNAVVLLSTDTSTTIYRQNVRIARLDALPAKGRVANINLQDSVIAFTSTAKLSPAAMALVKLTSGGAATNNFNNFILSAPTPGNLVLNTASNTLRSFNGGMPISSSDVTLFVRSSVTSRDPRTGKTPANGAIWTQGQARRFYFYHTLAQNGQLSYVTVRKYGSGCLPSGIAVTNIIDNSVAVKYEVEVIAIACKNLSVADIKSGKINVSIPMLVGTVGTAFN